MSKVLITGITGQDGALLADKLIKNGEKVYGLIRRGSTPKTGRLRSLGILNEICFLSCELTEFANVFQILRDIRPDTIYNLAAQSFVEDSFKYPHLTSQINYFGVLNILEAIRILGFDSKIYQASTSEMFGDVLETPQNEQTPFNPISPYAVSKTAAHHIVKNYRMSYGVNCASGILFNHESEFRGREFVTRKITSKLAEIKLKNAEPIELGNLSSMRDWGYARDFIDGITMICDSEKMDDYVLATNTVHSVREFLSCAAHEIGLDPEFDGEGENEVCLSKKTGQIIARVNKKYFRPSDVNFLLGDYRKINSVLGWMPKTTFEELVVKMVRNDMDMVSNGDYSF